MYDELVNWKPGSGVIAADFGRRSVQLYAELCNEHLEERTWQRSGMLVWAMRPKFHLFLHCLEDQVAISGNPRDAWCYCDESEIGAGVRVAESCHPSTLHRTIMQKHRLSV